MPTICLFSLTIGLTSRPCMLALSNCCKKVGLALSWKMTKSLNLKTVLPFECSHIHTSVPIHAPCAKRRDEPY